MIDISHVDYSDLDRPEVLMFLFHPRAEWEGSGACDAAEDVLIPVEEEKKKWSSLLLTLETFKSYMILK